MRQIIFDTETTGLDPADGHRLVELAGVEMINRTLTGRHLHLYVNPGRDSDPEALAIHGLTTQFLADHPTFDQIASQVIDFIKGAEVIIHNASFDLRFMDAELAKCGLDRFSSYCGKVTDSLLFARELHPGKRNNLDALCDRYGISNAHRTLHGALLDSELLADVWLAMTRGQESLVMTSAEDEISVEDAAAQLKRYDAEQLPVILATPAELGEHQAYLDALEQSNKQPPLWSTLANQ
ncbi:DNA polymerase III subunit epsilon [Paenalcaligenes niemegkensis]|uniref:DNA polymerase III subunit epsilon n=1 Tax=Paenalcaligenes niemegkensis TaxID=2895469 RepID=UPI001EE981A7|nr:DNA polymerase III subunit epsilon [Paenalcaligenes niemegkensis]MCQ9615372.1 DNA polymerase III subunit epsilon [Paenalcaligenes niemegkensis]